MVTSLHRASINREEWKLTGRVNHVHSNHVEAHWRLDDPKPVGVASLARLAYQEEIGEKNAINFGPLKENIKKISSVHEGKSKSDKIVNFQVKDG